MQFDHKGKNFYHLKCCNYHNQFSKMFEKSYVKIFKKNVVENDVGQVQHLKIIFLS